MSNELIILAKDSALVIVDGKPDIYVSNEDFDKILREPKIATIIREHLGTEKYSNGILIGRLGHEESGIYRDNAIKIQTPNSCATRDLCYYAVI